MIKVDQELCIGCGTCPAICPGVFKMDDETGKAIVISQDDIEGANNAAASCPVQAIIVA